MGWLNYFALCVSNSPRILLAYSRACGRSRARGSSHFYLQTGGDYVLAISGVSVLMLVFSLGSTIRCVIEATLIFSVSLLCYVGISLLEDEVRQDAILAVLVAIILVLDQSYRQNRAPTPVTLSCLLICFMFSLNGLRRSGLLLLLGLAEGIRLTVSASNQQIQTLVSTFGTDLLCLCYGISLYFNIFCVGTQILKLKLRPMDSLKDLPKITEIEKELVESDSQLRNLITSKTDLTLNQHLNILMHSPDLQGTYSPPPSARRIFEDAPSKISFTGKLSDRTIRQPKNVSFGGGLTKQLDPSVLYSQSRKRPTREQLNEEEPGEEVFTGEKNTNKKHRKQATNLLVEAISTQQRSPSQLSFARRLSFPETKGVPMDKSRLSFAPEIRPSNELQANTTRSKTRHASVVLITTPSSEASATDVSMTKESPNQRWCYRCRRTTPRESIYLQGSLPLILHADWELPARFCPCLIDEAMESAVQQASWPEDNIGVSPMRSSLGYFCDSKIERWYLVWKTPAVTRLFFTAFYLLIVQQLLTTAMLITSGFAVIWWRTVRVSTRKCDFSQDTSLSTNYYSKFRLQWTVRVSVHVVVSIVFFVERWRSQRCGSSWQKISQKHIICSRLYAVLLVASSILDSWIIPSYPDNPNYFNYRISSLLYQLSVLPFYLHLTTIANSVFLLIVGITSLIVATLYPGPLRLVDFFPITAGCILQQFFVTR